jgi:hypothetical protein
MKSFLGFALLYLVMVLFSSIVTKIVGNNNEKLSFIDYMLVWAVVYLFIAIFVALILFAVNLIGG